MNKPVLQLPSYGSREPAPTLGYGRQEGPPISILLQFGHIHQPP